MKSPSLDISLFIEIFLDQRCFLANIDELVDEVVDAQEKSTNSERFQTSLPISIFHPNSVGEQSTSIS